MTLNVSVEVVILSKSLATNLTGEPVLGLFRTVQNLVDLQLVFPSETFTTGRTLVRSLACVGHLMVPQQLQPIVFYWTVGALVAMYVEVFLHHVGLQLRTAFKRRIAGITEEWPLSSVDQAVSLQP